MATPKRRYVYWAKFLRPVDGDTLWLDVDMGLRVHVETNVRIRGIDAAPDSDDVGHHATLFVADWIARNADPDGYLFLETHKSPGDPHGRWLGDVTSVDGQHDLATDLLEAGLAVKWGGDGPHPVVS